MMCRVPGTWLSIVPCLASEQLRCIMTLWMLSLHLGETKMELKINEEQTKVLLKQIFSELLEEKRDLFTEIMVEAIEEIGLANAIREGRQNEFVSEDQVLSILRDNAS